MRRPGLSLLLPYLRPHRATLVLVAVLSLALAAITLAQPLMIRALLDGLAASGPVTVYVAVTVVLVVAQIAVGIGHGYLLERTAERLVLAARTRLVARLLRLPVVEYDQRRRGDLLSRVGADTTLLRAVVTAGLFDLVIGVFTVAGAAVAMIVLDPMLFLAMLTVLGAGLAATGMAVRRVRAASHEVQSRVGEMSAAVDRAITAVRTVRANRAEERETNVIVESARAAYRAGIRLARLQAVIGPASMGTVNGAVLATVGLGGARVASSDLTIGELVAFIMFLFFVVNPLSRALNAYAQLQGGLGALQRIEEILRIAPESAGDAPVAARAVAARRNGRPAVEFDRVSFGYPGHPPVLRDVSLAAPVGTRTALVGPSGAGKSTLLALVERFYDVTAGAVRVDGEDVRLFPRSRLRAQLGFVEQEAPVLAGTLRDNLLLATPGATDAELSRVLAEVNLADLGGMGLDTQVGDGGVLLSGGERQRLALARTLLTRPAILLLDEPTSNLDARNEAALRKAIDRASAGRTTLIVAHRLSTVVDADQIVVLDRGEVVAVGRHAELTDTNPLYREFAAHQLLVD